MKTITTILLVISCQAMAQIEVKLPRETKLLDCQGIEFANSQLLPAGQSIQLTDYYADYFTATANGKTGYIYYPYLDGVAGLESFKKERHDAYKGPRIEACRLQQLIKKYGEAAGRLAYQGKPWIGMHSGIAMDLFGAPIKVNKDITKNNNDQQWVYSNMYLYFNNGVLTAIQDSN